MNGIVERLNQAARTNKALVTYWDYLKRKRNLEDMPLTDEERADLDKLRKKREEPRLP